jgi:hypothetical protein
MAAPVNAAIRFLVIFSNQDTIYPPFKARIHLKEPENQGKEKAAGRPPDKKMLG